MNKYKFINPPTSGDNRNTKDGVNPYWSKLTKDHIYKVCDETSESVSDWAKMLDGEVRRALRKTGRVCIINMEDPSNEFITISVTKKELKEHFISMRELNLKEILNFV